ncbi:hypothetical protein ACLBXM_17255 [Xanthobacteraceae bacterium A53D]
MRALIILRHALIGLLLGLVATAVTLSTNAPTSRGALIGQMIGGLLGGALLLGLFGAVRARKIAADEPAPALSTGRRITLILSLSVLAILLAFVAAILAGVRF